MKKNDLKFKLFDSQRVGRGVSKDADYSTPNLKRFFYTMKDNFGKIVSVNILMVLGNFPLLFLLINLSGYFKTPYFLPASELFPSLFGIFSASGNVTPYQLAMLGMIGVPVSSLADTTVNYVFYGLSALTLLTFGCVNVGTAYVLRNIAAGKPAFVLSDFWYAIKRNWKQALPFGMIDLAVTSLLLFSAFFTMSNTADFIASILFWGTVAVIILWFFMRFYIYVQIVTFKLTVFKIIKNSLIFALLGIKRNLMALLGIALGLFLELFFVFGVGGILIPIAVAAPLAVLFSLFAYMKVFAAYFKIKEQMIDPYYAEHPEELPEEAEVETVMTDDVTERQRIDEIRKKNGLPKADYNDEE